MIGVGTSVDGGERGGGEREEGETEKKERERKETGGRSQTHSARLAEVKRYLVGELLRSF